MPPPSKAEIAQLIKRFLDGSAGMWDWDDFISVPMKNPDLEMVRRQAVSVHDRYPPTKDGFYCSEEGLSELRRLADSLEIASSSKDLNS